MVTISQLKEEAQEIVRFLHQTKKTFPWSSYNALAYESVKHVVNILAEYEPSHDSTLFSINNAKEVTENLINVTATIQNPKYHESPNKLVK